MATLRHLALRCRDVTVSRRFYEEGIGFCFVGFRPSGVSLDLSDGSSNITLLSYEGEDRPELAEGEEYVHFGIYVEDLVEVWQRLTNLGATGIRTVKGRDDIDADIPPDVAFKVLDPDGNVVDITSDPEEWRGAEMG